jgi:dihydrofolate reductase
LANSIDAAMGFARQDAVRRGVDEIMIIGGGDVFERMLPKADRLEITHVNASPEGDAFFPRLEPSDWREVKRVSFPAGPDDDASFDVATYVRR